MKKIKIMMSICMVFVAVRSRADVYDDFGIQRTNERVTNSLPDFRNYVAGETPIPPIFPYGVGGMTPDTFGELCSKSATILIATLAYPSGTALEGGVSTPRSINIVLEPEEFLLRDNEKAVEPTYGLDWGRGPEPEEGVRVLAFVHDTGILAGRSRRGLLFLGNPEDHHIIEVVRGYIRHIRGADSDPQAYFGFLHSLLDDPVDRVWRDAKTDLLALVRTFEDQELYRVMRDASVDADIRWYAELIRRYKRGEFKRPTPSPSEDDIVAYRNLMKSDKETEIREGMRILGDYSRWYRENSEQWVDVALPLLEHPNLLIRLSIAQRLTTVGHPASVPVIIEDGLLHDNMPSRSVSQGMLQQMLGEEIDFDPRGPEEDRKEQVEAFKQWWEENRHRYE